MWPDSQTGASQQFLLSFFFFFFYFCRSYVLFTIVSKWARGGFVLQCVLEKLNRVHVDKTNRQTNHDHCLHLNFSVIKPYIL